MNWIWPEIDDLDTAKRVSHSAAACAFFIAFVTGVVVYLQTTGRLKLFAGIGAEAYVDAGLFFLIGVGLLRKSRIAAVTGLIVYIAEQFYMMKSGMGRASFVMVVFILAFANAIRATFSYHEFKREEETRAAEARAVAGTVLPKKNRFLSFIFGGIIFSFCFFLALTAVTSGRLEKMNIKVPDPIKKFRFPNFAPPAPVEKPAASEEDNSNDPAYRTFRLKNGEVIKGKVLMEDDVYYSVEVAGGSQKIVIKEDLLKS